MDYRRRGCPWLRSIRLVAACKVSWSRPALVSMMSDKAMLAVGLKSRLLLLIVCRPMSDIKRPHERGRYENASCTESSADKD